MLRAKRLFSFLLVVLPFLSGAQHHDHATMETSTKEKIDTVVFAMTHAFSLSLPMNRNGSGTGWAPDETPMYAWMKHTCHWNYMLHGSLFLRYTMQNTNNNYQRGGKQFNAPNWLMGMAQRQVVKKACFFFVQ